MRIMKSLSQFIRKICLRTMTDCAELSFSLRMIREQFTLKVNESGRPILGTNETMLVQNTDIVETTVNNDVVSVSYVDFSGENNVVLRDGPLFYFTPDTENPNALWNSDDYYPFAFSCRKRKLNYA